MSFSQRLKHSIIPISAHSPRTESYERELLNGYQKMVNNEEFSDFVFIVKGKRFFAHKVILASVSKVFAAMFRSDMIEKQINEAIIDDIDCDVFEEFLSFLYTGKSAKIDEIAEKLLPVADKYDIFKLKSLCEHSIRLDNENVVRVLIIAYNHSVNGLKDRAIQHIIKNLKTVRSQLSDQWIHLITTYPGLVNEIFESVETQMNMKDESDPWLLYEEPVYIPIESYSSPSIMDQF